MQLYYKPAIQKVELPCNAGSIPGWEDPLEEGMTISPLFLPGESPRTEEPGRLQAIGSQRFGYDGAVKHSPYEELRST